MILEYELSSEPLYVSAKQVFLNWDFCRWLRNRVHDLVERVSFAVFEVSWILHFEPSLDASNLRSDIVSPITIFSLCRWLRDRVHDFSLFTMEERLSGVRHPLSAVFFFPLYHSPAWRCVIHTSMSLTHDHSAEPLLDSASSCP